MSDIYREEFEDAASRLGYNLTMAEHETGEYHYPVTQDAWDIWQEAIDAARQAPASGEPEPVIYKGVCEHICVCGHRWWSGNPDEPCPRCNPQPAQQGSVAEMNDEVRWILGRPNFACVGIAQYLRSQGREIQNKAEDEQAEAIYWMLSLYSQHGADWRQKASNLLSAPPQEQ